MNTNSLGLFNALADILNGDRQSGDYAIAYSLISHANDLSSVSITDIMAEAYVTRSAVRRFCNRIGFMNFSELKEQMTPVAYPSDLNHRDRSVPLETYRSDLDARMLAMFSEMRRTIDNDAIARLAQRLHDCSNVLMTCANNTSGIIGRFQQELFYAGKVVQLVDMTYHERLAELAADDDGMLVVVSASGVFAKSVCTWVDGATADKVLITAAPDVADWRGYDAVYCLSDRPCPYDALGLYGKYGISYFFDLLSACYLNMFAQ